MRFRLAEIDIRWSGTDDDTPPGHCIATGADTLGNMRTWLFAGSEPSDDGYRGNVLLPRTAESPLIAYCSRGAYVKSGYDHASLLAQLVQRPEVTEGTKS